MSEEDVFFGSDCFDTELFMKNRQSDLKMATRQEKRDLAEFIGGFERWTELDADCKMYIIGSLDYMSRSNLSLCSKLDNRIVKDTILYITTGKLPKNDGIRMRHRNLAELFKSDFEQENGEEMSLTMLVLRENFIEMRTSSNFVRSWKFSVRKNGCHIIAKSSMESKFTYSIVLEKSGTTAEAEIVKILKKILKKYKVKTLRTAVKFNTAPDFSDISASVKNLEIGYWADKKLWLSSLNPDVPLDSFSIYSHLEYPSRIPDGLAFEEIANPLVINAKTLRSAQHVNMTEEQFFSLKATRMAIGVGYSFKVSTIFEFIRRWVDNEIDEDFRQMELWINQSFMEEFKEKMDAREFDATLFQHPERYPNGEFFVKFREYNPWNAYFYEIRNKENRLKTLSVLVKSNFIVIYRTGLLKATNGVVEAEWVRPEGLIYLHLHSSPVLNV